jgi:hypothetical protein
LNAQTGNDFSKDVDNINKIFPAAPTANNLMKFEEVPVSYYTGIPDINIPLFNIPTNNPNVNLNVQLKYHPLSAKPEDKASETGLGWSLLAGGTITRTVRGGVADELIESTFMSDPPSEKYGIYKHENNPTYKLIFNQLTNWDLKEYAFYAAKADMTQNMICINITSWDTQEGLSSKEIPMEILWWKNWTGIT